MKWSWRIGRFAGIDVKVHATFIVLVLFLGYLSLDHGWQAALFSMALVVGVFACVVLHEFGHALMALRFGVTTRDITLYPIGGVARLERLPEEPLKELAIAAAGPAVNVLIAGVLGLLVLATDTGDLRWSLATYGSDFLHALLEINVILICFNALPAFPMDGGRVLRALLALKIGYLRATRIAGGIGKVMAMLFALVGMTGLEMLGLGPNPVLVVIGLFVYLGASQETSMAQLRSSAANRPVSAAMIRDFVSLDQHDTVASAMDRLLFAPDRDFPVVADGRPLGMLTREDLLRAAERKRFADEVGGLVRKECGVVLETDPLDEALHRMGATGCRSLPVVRDGAIIGLVTMERLREYVAVLDALGALMRRAAGPPVPPATPPPVPRPPFRD